ncbi:MAG: type II toxin-antitoxin system RelE/ParE family toxin [Schleiferiaceae bacterium]|nr:type II toxin-antitoxin system RelE/ParE family toxin [Schleiferiaceae bacterium]
MSYKIEVTADFEKDLKKIFKKHRSIKNDLAELITSLETNPQQGTPLGNNCYKIRLAIASKGKGKSGGARVITNIVVDDTTVYLLTIYDKTDKETLSNKELEELLKSVLD